ncbi:GNAT family N-acetyltransferase [Brachybacterium alimentarium]|uniref:N-acetyltransferase domain-containing protein n=1 Tax=Brachybacterium alimentarium TaxID=47845 RepID=A0A2A3YLW9_9MICO|nr:GNAT family N-acetyltransferase [Brachybacterium alimentarium]PCC35987.1 hypothetical protein CIK71_01260 [Brachybacterium alimentarium]PCC40281.1 hypothetical protein CIK66_03780 [Brachybacterium alimentarium]RCS71610.1 GNAT family N-acetyltransferase [Brachybacterium alimentarium]RCS79464.1 GNAT family N-acetyltransferase [Brachybacterium alimentarium]RCS81173.1 GNAT family N-acetyltransferase [Brachybacterium alimentarium]
MDIRSCTAADLSLLTSLWPLRGEVHEAHFARQQEGRSEYLVAWRDGVPLGSAVVRWDGCSGAQARASHPDAFEICHLQVRPERRGQGVGTQLIAAAEHEALTRGHRVAAMAVGDDNARAQRLYERLGYRTTGIFDVTEYDWTADDGTLHHARERDQLLLKQLRIDDVSERG